MRAAQTRQVSYLAGVLVTLLTVGVACWPGDPDLVLDATVTVFPGEARLGASAMISLDSDVFNSGDVTGLHEISRANLTLRVDDESGGVTVSPTAVFSVRGSRSSQHAGQEVKLAYFDLPASLDLGGLGYPYTTEITPVVDGTDGFPGSITIIGEGGQPTPLGVAGNLTPNLHVELESRDLIRLRARHSDGVSVGFNDGETTWTIGAMEFDVLYTPLCITHPNFTTSGAASWGLLTKGPWIPVGSLQATYHLVFIDPNGFQIPQGVANPSAAGEGPIIDIAFTWPNSPPACGTIQQTADSHLVLSNLYVTDPDGNTLIDERDAVPDQSEDYFDLYVIERSPSA